MKKLTIFFVLILLAGCLEPRTNRSSRSSSNGDQNFSATLPDSSIVELDDSTDQSDSTDDPSTSDGSTGLLPEPEEETEEESTLEEYCGVLYKSSNGNFTFIDGTTGSYSTVQDVTANASAVLENISFPNDSYSACLSGEKKLQRVYTVQSIYALSSKIPYSYTLSSIDASYIMLSEAYNPHPERESLTEAFRYEYCGEFEYITFAGDDSTEYLQLTTDIRGYLLEGESSIISKIEDALEGKSRIEGCVYGDSAAYNNYDITYKKYFDVEDSYLLE